LLDRGITALGSGNMNNSVQLPRALAPQTPRRSSTSVDGRPFTSSGGDLIEPTSAFLRDALRERKGIQSRSRSSTPRRPRPNARQDAPKDEWLQLSGDEGRSKDNSASARPIRQRRASDLAVAKGTTSIRAMTTQEVETKMDRLEKESWDLKHRIMLYQERAKQLSAKLEEKEQELERLKGLQETNEALVEELEKRDQQIKDMEADNAEITAINEELVEELDLRVKELQAAQEDAEGRQNAIEEAAGIIQTLEHRVIDQQKQLSSQRHSDSPPRPDSDYYSADGGRASQKAAPALLKPPSLTNSTTMDSDYFSADTSPLVTPKSTRHAAPSTEKPPPLSLAQDLAASFDREIGIKSITSKDSLFSAYLDSPALPPTSTATARVQRLRSLRRRTTSPKPTAPATAGKNLETQRARRSPHGWSNNRPLRNMYVTSHMGGTVEPTAMSQQPTRPEKVPQKVPYSPQREDARGDGRSRSSPTISVTQPASPGAPKKPVASPGRESHVRANSTAPRPPAVLVRHTVAEVPGISQPSRRAQEPYASGGPSHPTTWRGLVTGAPSSANSSPASRASKAAARPKLASTPSSDPNLRTSGSQSGSAQHAQMFLLKKPTTETHTHAPNFAVWPKKYPAWPPSAGLRNRDVLFHGDGMDEMFGAGKCEGDDDDRPW
jgi:hypothetical protein